MQSRLFAVQMQAARDGCMLIFALAMIAAEPTQLTDAHKRDLACVATIAAVAYEQQKGGWQEQPDMALVGKRWAGVVGDRIVAETGQAREAIAVAMLDAANAEKDKRDDIEARKDRIADCSVLMYRELNALDAKPIEYPVPIRQP
jgi:hypothetical protein